MSGMDHAPEAAPVTIGSTPGSAVRDVHAPVTSGTDRLAVHFSSKPTEASVGKPVTLGLHIEGTDVKPAKLATVHEKKNHTIVVSEDMSEFAHIHPEAKRGGTYAVDYTPAKAGGHRVFAEMTADAPGAATELKRFDVDVAGHAERAVPLKIDTAPKTVGTLK